MPQASEQRILEVGQQLAAAFPPASRNPLRTADQRALQLVSEDAPLRAALLRFVDVAPACDSPADLAAHLVDYMGEVDHQPVPLEMAMRVGDSHAGRVALGTAAAAAVRHVSHRFIVGETPAQASRVIRSLWRDGICTSVDLLGEATVSAAEADRYGQRCALALEEIAAVYERLPRRPALEADSIGGVPRVNLSVKVSALTPLLRPAAPELGQRDAEPRLRGLLRRAHELDAHLHIDMESFDSREAVTELVLDLLGRQEFRDGPSAGVVLQAYLRDSPAACEQIIASAAAAGRRPPLLVRRVQGAYWDHEFIDAVQHGWRPPVFAEKADCDRNFEKLTRRLLEARPHVRVAVASHNLRSVAHAIAAAEAIGADRRDLEFQVLRGLGDELGYALASEGFRVRVYCPVGDLLAGMAYLVRRLLENTANESFLTEQASGRPLEELLAAP
jgi:proline dehydrogenase